MEGGKNWMEEIGGERKGKENGNITWAKWMDGWIEEWIDWLNDGWMANEYINGKLMAG